MKEAQSNLLVKGAVHIRCIDTASGKLLQEVIDDNLVVDLGRTNVGKLLGGIAGGEKIDTIGVGTSNTGALPGDTTLTSSFTRAMNGNTTYTSPAAMATFNYVRFAFTILTTEANGMTIWEFGLLNTSGILCARKVLSTSIAKTSSFAIEGEWIVKVL